MRGRRVADNGFWAGSGVAVFGRTAEKLPFIATRNQRLLPIQLSSFAAPPASDCFGEFGSFQSTCSITIQELTPPAIPAWFTALFHAVLDRTHLIHTDCHDIARL